MIYSSQESQKPGLDGSSSKPSSSIVNEQVPAPPRCHLLQKSCFEIADITPYSPYNETQRGIFNSVFRQTPKNLLADTFWLMLQQQE